MFKPNYSFAKRQRELAKQKKKEEKRQRKTGKGDNQDTPESAATPDLPEPLAPPPAAPANP